LISSAKRLAIAFALAAVAVAGCGGDEQEGDEPTAEPAPGEEISVDEIFGDAPVIGEGASVAFGEGAVWMTPGLIRIDPPSGQTEALPITGAPNRVAAGEGAVWVIDLNAVPDSPDPPAVRRIDPGSGRPAGGPIWVGGGLDDIDDIAVGDGFVWVTDQYDRTLKRIDPASVKAEQVELPSDPASVAVGGGFVWVTSDNYSESAVETLARIDAGSGEVSEAPIGGSPHDVAYGFGAVWVASGGDDGAVKKIDPNSGDVIEEISLGEGSEPGAIAVGEGAVWVANSFGEDGDESVTRIDPATGATYEMALDGSPAAIAVGDGAVWVPVLKGDDAPPALMRIPVAELPPSGG
jgi:streptogramin lyase